MIRRRRQNALLAFGVLTVAATHCVALSNRRLITFEEAHITAEDLATKETNEVAPVALPVSGDISYTKGGATNSSLSTSSLQTTVSATVPETVGKNDQLSTAPVTSATPTATFLPAQISLPPDALAGDPAEVSGEATTPEFVVTSNSATAPVSAVPSNAASTEAGAIANPLTPISQGTPPVVVSGETDSPDTLESIPTDAAAGLATNTPSSIPASSAAPWIESSGSNSRDNTVAIAPLAGNGANDESSDSQASKSDELVDGYDATKGVGVNFNKGNEREKKNTKIEETHNSTGESPGCCDTDTSTNSKDGKSGLDDFLKPGGVSDVYTSSATYNSLDTGSVVAIIGVIAAIIGLIVLFVVMSRKKYKVVDESPLPYGYNMDLRSIARPSPTFMHDDSILEGGRNGTALIVTGSSPHHGSADLSGEIADELGSLPNVTMTNSHRDPLVETHAKPNTENVRVSALYSSGSSMTSGSRVSSSWSSVLASESDHQSSTRDTRDTTFSGWSASNLSNFGSSGSGASGRSRFARSSSNLSVDFSQTGNSDQSRSLTRLSEAPRIAAGPVDSNCSDQSTEV
ncbi:uncharacterized protein PHALS_13051 [Plasmopara halstedii]|uniref:Uncharacterized protein n=1 Tax=Plasmopara halstedii TaxID=4781 RepID=A0A0P1APQ0_PLAHL|nr:uncharacterized protein PHALS_13051 [Plasmopara halstedii]CEG42806.1 hypothetical protein PHALS_13051 [Plasmopara halstedii]|eukprot:XP_024579175.1 hypothetical protein PHALS_13051 [Plasmopara halstedii]